MQAQNIQNAQLSSPTISSNTIGNLITADGRSINRILSFSDNEETQTAGNSTHTSNNNDINNNSDEMDDIDDDLYGSPSI